MIPFFDAKSVHSALASEFGTAFERVLANSSFILGDEVSAFEREFADFCGVKHCVTVGNGLDALILALRGWGIGPGDEVIVPGQTFVATWLAVSAVGATPVAVDVEADSVLMDLTKVQHALSSKTKAVIPVHLYGRAVDISKLRSLIPSSVKILEDAAQAHGAYSGDRRVGSLGDAAAFSFYPTKNLGCLGDGGAVTTSDSKLAEDVAKIRNYGSRTKYVHEVAGVNSRLDEIQAAFLRIKLPLLDKWNDQRRRIAARYQHQLADIGGLTLPSTVSLRSHVFHLYVVKTDRRAALQEALSSEGITSLIHYPVTPGDQPIYRELSYSMPVAALTADTCLSLPIWPGMEDDKVDRVAETIRRFMKR